MRRLARGAALAAFVSWAAAAGCRGPADWRYREALEETPEAAAHAVHQERLGEVMRDLDALRSARLPTALDPREERERRAAEVARVATAMARAAEQIRRAAPTGLDAAERADFEALADELARQCRDLAAEAATAPTEELGRRLQRIDATCQGCHRRFRLPGVPDGGG